MRTYKIFHPLWLSFYSQELYRDVARHWPGACFLYLFMMLALAWIPIVVKIHIEFKNFAENEGATMIAEIPTITITDGEVTADVEQPYVIRDPEKKDEILAIIDTTGEITSLENTEAKILLSKSELLIKQSEFETTSYDLSPIKEFSFDRTVAESWLNLFAQLLAPLIYVLVVPLSLVYRILQALLYAAIGLLFARGVKAPLKYPALLRLAVIAVSPVIVLDTLRDFLSIQVPYLLLLSFIVAMAYLLFGIKANAEPEAPPPNAPAETPPAL